MDQVAQSDKIYSEFLAELKVKVAQAQVRTALAASKVLIEFYWNLGCQIVKLEESTQWGGKLLDRLSVDLKLEYSDIKGFSRRNLYAIRQWYLFFSQRYEFVPQAVAQLPWGHQRLLVSLVKDVDLALQYAQLCIENSWSRDTLEANIKTKYHLRLANQNNNFKNTLPVPQSDLAEQTIKNPYIFDFVEIENVRSERFIEKELIKHLSEFMVELGKGFAYVGHQINIVVNNNDYYLDLLFYHLKLR